jgi:hypothetical protein
MRLLLLAASFAACTVIAQDSPFLKGEDLAAEVAKSCGDGCITFNMEEAAEYQRRLDLLIAQKERRAYEAGQANQKQACRSLI